MWTALGRFCACSVPCARRPSQRTSRFVASRRALLAGVMLVLSVACSNGDDIPDDELAFEWHIDSVPMLSIADDDARDEPVIGDAVGVIRLPEGGVVIADRALSSLRFFDADGSFTRSVGRAGRGPGEFEYIATMHRCGDSLYVQDIGHRSISVLTIDGVLSRAPSYAEIYGERSTYHSACNGSGVFVHNGWSRNEDQTPGRTRWIVPYWLTNTDGVIRTELGDHAGSERLVIPGGSGPHPLGRNPVLAIGRERVYIGTADSFLVMAFALDGKLAGALRNTDADLRTTAEDIARFKLLDTLGANEMDKASSLREWSTVEFPPTIPAYDAMLVDAADHVWVRRYPRGADQHAEWLVFSSSGEQVATVRLPSTLTVHEVGLDYVLGIEVDPTEGQQMVPQFGLKRTR